MIIHQPEVMSKEGHTIVWSRVELSQSHAEFPEYIWYRVPDQYAKYASTRSDAFLMPLLIAGMYFGEDMDVRGVVSPKLAYHLDEYRHLLCLNVPQYFRQISIRYEQLQAWKIDPWGVAVSFSGGVDSFFTLQKHLPTSQYLQEYRVTHALFIHHFDILNRNKEYYEWLNSLYSSSLDDMGVELVPLQTNAFHAITQWMSLRYVLGPVQAGCGAFLGGLFRKYLMSASRDHRQLAIRMSSSNPLSDSLLSTETLEMVHYGASSRRVDKVVSISDWRPAQTHLRTCGQHHLKAGEMNCSRCEKCLRTLVSLYVLGKHDQFTVFDRPFRSNWDLLLWAKKFDPKVDEYGWEIFSLARNVRPDLLPWLWAAGILGTLRYWLLKLIPLKVKKWLGRYGYFVDQYNDPDAFEDTAILELIRSSKQRDDLV